MDILLSWKLWAFLAAVATAVGAVVLLKPWIPIIAHTQMALARRDRRILLKYIRKAERNFDKAASARDIFGVPVAPARMKGHVLVAEPAAVVIERMHNVSRRTHKLPPIKINAGGVIDQDRLDRSFHEIQEWLEEFSTYVPGRDLTTVAAWCAVLAFLFAAISIVLA